MNFPRFDRQIIAEEIKDAEDWKPTWQCYCCHDSGVILDSLVREIIPEYNPLTDKRPLCQACDASNKFFREACESYKSHDTRFNRSLCQALAKQEYEEWEEQRLEWHKMKSQVEQVVSNLSEDMGW